ncbi:hypothetical protein ACH5RR_029750 [Cinchona calisaya]|uniref:Uncharacterized protein n=1 Tax=Cinchona calisaya TaxID=153742 RepID=A0ABD2YU23_9GENT
MGSVPSTSTVVVVEAQPITTVFDVDSTIVQPQGPTISTRASIPAMIPITARVTIALTFLLVESKSVLAWSTSTSKALNMALAEHIQSIEIFQKSKEIGYRSKATEDQLNPIIMKDNLPNVEMEATGLYDLKMTAEALDELKAMFRAHLPIAMIDYSKLAAVVNKAICTAIQSVSPNLVLNPLQQPKVKDIDHYHKLMRSMRIQPLVEDQTWKRQRSGWKNTRNLGNTRSS